jgi:hypothetical protein
VPTAHSSFAYGLADCNHYCYCYCYYYYYYYYY